MVTSTLAAAMAATYDEDNGTVSPTA